MNKFRSFIAPLIQEYIFYRKASDHWNESSYEPNLLLFDRYCLKECPNAQRLSQEMVDKWCCKRNMEENNSCRSRIYVVVSFIRYITKRGKTDIVIPAILESNRGLIYHMHLQTKNSIIFFRLATIYPEKPHLNSEPE